ncbi:MAG: LysM peptidoglycan-binding domain-containing protein [Nitrospinaceae bacterium]
MAKRIRNLGLYSFLFTLFVSTSLLSPAFANLPDNIHTLSEYNFSVPPGLEDQVDFWKKIYTKYTTDYAVIHDSRDLKIIYEVVYLGGDKFSRRNKERKLNRVKAKYRKILRKLAKKKNKAFLKGEEKRIFDMVRNGFYRAARNIRSQIGQRDRFEGGLKRSGRYMREIRQILSDKGLPEELSALPHVESSFQTGAYSSAGAAGIWQFTRGTGRLFMRVRYDVDERRDPIFSTQAAAKLLKLNFEELQSWPLAITAYNHGTQGMKRAKRRYGDNIVTIIKNYRSRTFGFASQNFYAEFLAALHVVRHEEKYFPNLTKAKPLEWVSMRFDDYVHIDSVMKYFQMSREDIARANPSLRGSVIRGQKRIPKGFVFKAAAQRFDDLVPVYQRIPGSEKHHRQIRSKWYTVRRGDTLSGVALRFGTTVRQLKRLNHIGRRNRIYMGKVLRLPERNNWRKPSLRVVKAQKPLKNYDTSQGGIYTVRKHDNLTKIARRFQTNSGELIRLNKIKNPNSLYPGQTLKVRETVLIAQNTQTDAGSADKIFPKASENSMQEAKLEVKSAAPAFLADKVEKGDRVLPTGPHNEVKPSVPVQLASNPPPSYRLNKNRPAFLPVAFTSNARKKARMGVITVDFDETLSHYAEWAQLPVRKLRRVNHLRRGASIPVHRKIQVPFTNIDPDKFEERRQEYHKAIQEDFFNNYRVSKLLVRGVKKGETLWEICNDQYFIPFWLLNSYNPEKDINSLAVGEPLVIPIITPMKSKDT